MPTPTKTLDAMSKNLTSDEKAARLEAEASVIPNRGEVVLKKPAWLKGKGKKYWDSILDRMEGTAILDDLDTEMLAIHCSLLAEMERLQADLESVRKKDESDSAEIDRLDKRIEQRASLIQKYADALGLTPRGRVQLAQKRAAKAAEVDVDGDLFGD